eukprot:scaffold613_cov152-Isochrysis_galbana.AAC.1
MRKSRTENRLAGRAAWRTGDPAALDRQPLHDSVEAGTSVPEARLAAAQCPEVLGGARTGLAEEIDHQPTGRRLPDAHVQIHARRDAWRFDAQIDGARRILSGGHRGSPPLRIDRAASALLGEDWRGPQPCQVWTAAGDESRRRECSERRSGEELHSGLQLPAGPVSGVEQPDRDARQRSRRL